MIDYSTPRFKTSDVAKAADLSAPTLRSYFGRGHFRVIGDEHALDRRDADVEGVPNLYSFRDALHVGTAACLIAANVHPAKAWKATMRFVHVGTEARLPGELFKQGLTLLIYRPKSDRAQIIHTDHDMALKDKLLHVPSDLRDPVIVINLNDVHDIMRVVLNA